MNAPSEPDIYPPTVDHLNLRANGLQFYAAAAGPASGPLVLLLHGFPEFSFAWRKQLGPLAARGFRVVAPDQRGYGLSGKPAGRSAYAAPTLVNDVLAIADSLGADRFSVVGHDWGGIVAWHLATMHPERLDSVAILNAPHPATLIDELMAHPSQAVKSSYVALFQMPWLPEVVLGAANGAVLERALVASSSPGTFSKADLDVYHQAWAKPGALTGMLNWYRALPISPSLKGTCIDVPVRVLWGDKDSALNPGLAERAAAYCARCEVTHFADATHWVHHEKADRVSRLLAEFLMLHAADGDFSSRSISNLEPRPDATQPAG